MGDRPSPDIPDYAVVDRIHVGAGSTVYRGERPGTGELVAIKVFERTGTMDVGVAERRLAAAHAAGTAGCANIVEVVDGGRLPDGRVYLVMEHLIGLSLADELGRRGAMSVQRACSLVRTVARAICVAHAVGVVHGQLSASQVIFAVDLANRSMTVKVIGFGAADDGASPGLDVCALGWMLVECLTGELHDGDEARASTLGSRLPELPAELARLIDACVGRDAEARAPTARDLLGRLVAVVAAFRGPTGRGTARRKGT